MPEGLPRRLDIRQEHFSGFFHEGEESEGLGSH